jgi:hypothetical protein
MRIEFSLPSPIEAEGPKDVKPNELVSLPFFYGNGASQAVAALAKVYTDDGRLAYMGVLRVSGKDGSLSIQERTQPVRAAVDEPEPAKK